MRDVFNMDGPLMSSLNKITDLLWLNILTILCCIPIITAGSAITALYYMTIKIVKNEEGYITRSYFKSFKENLKQSTILWILILIVSFVIYMDYYIIQYSGLDFPKALVIILSIIPIILVMILQYVFPLQARYENKIKDTLKNALLVSISNLPKTVLLILIKIIPIALFYFIPQITPIILMFGFSFVALLDSFILVSIFKKIEPQEEEESIEGADYLKTTE